jgi:hypothetical protein
VKPAERRAEFDPRQRFRPYRLTRATEDARGQEWLAAAGCPTEAGIGLMLVTLKADGEYGDSDSIGILDTAGWEHGSAGSWVINPHAR